MFDDFRPRWDMVIVPQTRPNARGKQEKSPDFLTFFLSREKYQLFHLFFDYLGKKHKKS